MNINLVNNLFTYTNYLSFRVRYILNIWNIIIFIAGWKYSSINWWWRKIYIFRSVAHKPQNIYVEIQKITEDFKLMPLSYLEQEILAKEKKSYGQENLKAKKIWDKRNAIKLTKLIVYRYFKKRVLSIDA